MKPRTRAVLDHMRLYDGEWVRGAELASVGGFRYSARLYELRAEGFVIERKNDRLSSCDMYRLVERVAA